MVNDESSEFLRRVPAHDESAEQQILGAILQRNDIIDLVMAEVETEDFYRENFRVVYAAMIKLAEDQSAIEAGLIKAVIGEKNFERIQGSTLCFNAVEMCAAPSTAPQYAREVHRRAIQRAALAFGHEVVARTVDAPAPGTWTKDWTDEMLADIEYGASQLARRQVAPPETPKEGAIAEAIYKLKHGIGKGIPTGFRNIDYNFDGFAAGELNILAARTSKGKTALATNFALNAAKAGYPTAYFTLEMSQEQMWVRCLGTLAQVDTFDVRRNGLTDEREKRLRQAEAELVNDPFTILYRPSITPRAFRLECKRLIREMGLKFAVVDYFNLMRGNKPERERWREMQEVVLAMKAIAGELGITVLLLSQLNREGDHDGPPSLTNLRDTGSMEEHGTNVILVWQKPLPKDAPPYAFDDWEDIEVILAKQRNGPVGGSIKMKFRKQWGAFIDR
jgi:replicative DNA helicase